VLIIITFHNNFVNYFLAKRNQLLKEMGFKTEKGKTIIVPAEEPIGMGDLGFCLSL
jgi:hypothetical protein